MRHRTLLRALLLVGLTFVVSGLTLGYHFSFAFDTWTSTVVSAPPGLDVPGDFAETVFYESDELRDRIPRSRGEPSLAASRDHVDSSGFFVELGFRYSRRPSA